MKLLALGVVLGLLIAIGGAFAQRGAAPAQAAKVAQPAGRNRLSPPPNPRSSPKSSSAYSANTSIP